uniref:HEAT repeat domain-containing protein n=1 Tax=mine drainage metagenome TaxID=410659 RepID=E6Q421_9ZZZZ
MTAALIVAFIFLRTRNSIARRRQNQLTQRWRSIFKTAYTGEAPPEVLPRVGRRDWFTVIALFSQFHQLRDKDRGRAREVLPKLDAMAYDIGLDRHALYWLNRGDDAEKILALTALGQLRERAALDDAIRLSADEGAELSRAAAQCALRIDDRFTDGVLELVRDRDDWVRSRVEAMLKEIDQIDLDEALRAAVANADEAGRRRLLDFVRFCSPSPARAVCKRVLDESQESETIAAALRSLAPLASEEDRALALVLCERVADRVVIGVARVKEVRPLRRS